MSLQDPNAPFWVQVRAAKRRILEFALECSEDAEEAAARLGIDVGYFNQEAKALGGVLAGSTVNEPWPEDFGEVVDDRIVARVDRVRVDRPRAAPLPAESVAEILTLQKKAVAAIQVLHDADEEAEEEEETDESDDDIEEDGDVIDDVDGIPLVDDEEDDDLEVEETDEDDEEAVVATLGVLPPDDDDPPDVIAHMAGRAILAKAAPPPSSLPPKPVLAPMLPKAAAATPPKTTGPRHAVFNPRGNGPASPWSLSEEIEESRPIVDNPEEPEDELPDDEPPRKGIISTVVNPEPRKRGRQPAVSPDPSKYCTYRDAAAITGLSLSAIHVMRNNGRLQPVVRGDGKGPVLFDRSAVEAVAAAGRGRRRGVTPE